MFVLLGTVVGILGKPTASSRTARSVTTSEARAELEPAKPSYLAALVSCQTLGSPSGSTGFPADVRKEAVAQKADDTRAYTRVGTSSLCLCGFLCA